MTSSSAARDAEIDAAIAGATESLTEVKKISVSPEFVRKLGLFQAKYPHSGWRAFWSEHGDGRAEHLAYTQAMYRRSSDQIYRDLTGDGHSTHRDPIRWKKRKKRVTESADRWAGFGEPVRRFMSDYHASTTQHVESNPHRDPHPEARRHGNGVVSEIHPRFDPIEGEREEAHLGWIHAPEGGKGHGSMALRSITALADRHGVTMTLEPSRPPGHRGPGPDDDGLTRWYGKHGFRMGEYGVMVRTPKGAVGLSRSRARGSE